MDILSQFEYPLPVVSADIEKICFEASQSMSASFHIINIGGGELNGWLSSETQALQFSPVKFIGNNVEISYSFNINAYRPGDMIESTLLIVSNGGELLIPIQVEIIPPEIYTKDGQRIASLMDYMFYAKSKPVPSRQLFTQKEFMMWLLSMNYEHMELYERFSMDTNKERAVDNFLILNKLKRKARLNLIKRNIHIKLKYSDDEPVTGSIQFNLNGWGFIDLRLGQNNGSGVIKLLTNKLSCADFDDSGFGEATFAVYPALLKKRILTERIVLSGDLNVSCCVTLSRERPMSAGLSKLGFDYLDNGLLKIKNTSGRDVMVEVKAKDSCIKFEGRRYYIGENAELPFEINVSAIQKAQLVLRKQPVINSEITVCAIDGDIRFEKKLSLYIGSI